MTTEAEKTIPIVVHVPAELGLTRREAARLQAKWETDLTAALADGASKIKWHISVHIEVGSE